MTKDRFMDQGKRPNTPEPQVGGPNATRGDDALGREDWIEAAIGLLASRGVGAVKITQLAENLGVTRGSFYWHFKDREDLLAALIKAWDKRNTKALVSAVEGSTDLVEGVLAIFECWLRAEPFAPRLDAALRDWGHHEDEVRRKVKRADRKRVKAIAGVFERGGFAPQEAVIRARILYYTQVGYYALEEEESMAQRNKNLASYFKAFTGRDLDAARVAAFSRRIARPAGSPKSPKKKKEQMS
jgi:AcrR family transcriptional regulator